MARKRKTVLPRLTLLAYSRRDLLAFTEAVEALRHLVDDLRLLVEKKKRRSQAATKANQTRAANPAENGEQSPALAN